MCSPWSGEQLPSHVVPFNSTGVSEHFLRLFFHSFPRAPHASRPVMKARHKTNVWVSKHLLHFRQPSNHNDRASWACYWLLLREIPTFQGKLHGAFRWIGEIICVCTFLFHHLPPLQVALLLVLLRANLMEITCGEHKTVIFFFVALISPVSTYQISPVSIGIYGLFSEIPESNLGLA